MDSKFIKPLVALGVPGVALGIFYLLLKSFSFQFSAVDPTWTVVIVILFLFIVGGITLFALHRWSPKRVNESADSTANEEMKQNNNTEDFVYVVNEERITFEEKMVSLGKDVVKIYAHTHPLGVSAEYRWIEHKYPGAKLKSQALSTLELLTKEKMEKEIYFDVVKIELEDGRIKEIYFDISEFVRHNMGSSINDSNAYMADKLKELYA
ncbi:TPA: hypothetical protein LNF46_003507 [Vibrio cholerae]|nr:hypothetical protein [Vibrio cholerae]HBK7271899.1 hypothetical protein [Vibrio cholerae]HBK7294049.1 hypothetical protein [Vibrio cholerae]HBK7297568.1 hypothetical protein [Vibrio cholerae]